MSTSGSDIQIGVVGSSDARQVEELEARRIDSLWTGGHIASRNPSPEAMVDATAVPHIAPTKFVDATMTTACRGVSTRVATTVAIELAVSWNPLMYSNTSAIRITTKINVMVLVRARQEFLSTMCEIALPQSRQRSMARSKRS